MNVLLGLNALKLVTAAALAVSVFALVFAGASGATGDSVRLGLRGLKRHRALASSALWRLLEPGVRWLGVRVRGFLGDAQRRYLDRQIEVAGDFLGLLPEEFLALNLLTVLGGAMLGAVLGAMSGLSHLATALGTGYGILGLHLAVSNAAAARLQRISRELPHAIDLLSLSVGAGLDLPGAIAQVIAKSGDASTPLLEELALVLSSLELGRTRRQALEEFGRRAPCDAVSEFVNAMVQAELRGTPISTVLQIQASVARQRRSTRAEEVAAKAGVKLLLPLALAFLSVLILVVAPIVVKLSRSSM
jgi:tight adherence protein C